MLALRCAWSNTAPALEPLIVAASDNRTCLVTVGDEVLRDEVLRARLCKVDEDDELGRGCQLLDVA